MRLKPLIALSAVFATAACSSSTNLKDSVELKYSIFSVNGQSPDAKTIYDISGDKISIPRGSLLLHSDGTVVEILQYTITRPNGIDTISATDTTYGHYEQINEGYDIRMPNSFGTEAFSGSIQQGTDFVQLSRTWKKSEVTVSVNIVFASS